VCPQQEELPNDTFSGTYNGEKINRTYSPTLKSVTAAEVGANPEGGWMLYFTGASNITKKLSRVADNSVLLVEQKLYQVNWYNSVYPYNFCQAVYTNHYPQGTYADYMYSAWFAKHYGKANFLFKAGNVQTFAPKWDRFNADWQLQN
jgi:hypothetical protein